MSRTGSLGHYNWLMPEYKNQGGIFNEKPISYFISSCIIYMSFTGCTYVPASDMNTAEEKTEKQDTDKGSDEADESQVEEEKSDKSVFSGQIEVTVPGGEYMDYMKNKLSHILNRNI